MCRVNSRSSCCNSPGEVLHVGASSVALQPPVPDISEITDTHTHTQNTAINIIDYHYFYFILFHLIFNFIFIVFYFIYLFLFYFILLLLDCLMKEQDKTQN